MIYDDIGNRREFGHKEEQKVFNIIGRLESLIIKIHEYERLPLSLTNIDEIIIFPGQYGRRRRGKGFMFSLSRKS